MQLKNDATTIVRALPAPARGAIVSKAIKTRVNKLAHQRAAAYEQVFKVATMAQLQRWADEGRPLTPLLDKLEKLDE